MKCSLLPYATYNHILLCTIVLFIIIIVIANIIITNTDLNAGVCCIVIAFHLLLLPLKLLHLEMVNGDHLDNLLILIRMILSAVTMMMSPNLIILLYHRKILIRLILSVVTMMMSSNLIIL